MQIFFFQRENAGSMDANIDLDTDSDMDIGHDIYEKNENAVAGKNINMYIYFYY